MVIKKGVFDASLFGGTHTESYDAWKFDEDGETVYHDGGMFEVQAVS